MTSPVLRSPQNPHFFQPLLPGFQNHLKVPVKFFSMYIEGKYESKTVTLRSDASEIIWKVKMEGRLLTEGWKAFVEAHDLRIGDIVIFKGEGDLLFHVTPLGPSCCEIQYAPSHSQNEDEEESGESGTEHNLETEVESLSSDQSCFTANVTDESLRADRLYLPRKLVRYNFVKRGTNNVVLMNETLRKWKFSLQFRKSDETFYMRRGWRDFCHENDFKPGYSITFKLERNNPNTPLLRFSTAESKRNSTIHSSKGKRETGESSRRVSAPSSSLSEDRFVTLTVSPTNGHWRPFLPRSFTKLKNMGGTKINMLDKKGVAWPVSLLFEKINERMRLGGGLRKFLDAVGVKAHETFVLELVWENKTSPPVLKFCNKVVSRL